MVEACTIHGTTGRPGPSAAPIAPMAPMTPFAPARSSLRNESVDELLPFAPGTTEGGTG